MRSRSTALLSIAAAAGLLLAGCASTAEPEPTASSAASKVVESSVTDPAAAGERVGADGNELEVWSSTVPDESAAGTLGDPDAGNQWVTVNVAQWVTDEGQKDVDVAPVLRSTDDESFSAEAVSQRSVEVPMTPEKSYTFTWSFQVPEDLVDPQALVLCVGSGDEGCSSLVAE
jgi:outer membrane murein-binding lipoprotein Lpp